ncbi:hypothetical protein BDZ89DRAFT_1139589 [Hymenopellis radicata]|nr:hypothetical protein BDZ89DRAFT_1139589 [Hymenopellis radicata]
MPTVAHPPSEDDLKPRRHLPPAAHMMNVDDRQVLVFQDMKDTDLIIAYAMGGTRPQPDEGELYRGVKRALESLIPFTPTSPSPYSDRASTQMLVGISQHDDDVFPWQLAFHDPGDGVRTIVAVVTDLSLDDSDESCEQIYDTMANKIRNASEVKGFVEANRDLYPADATTTAILDHICSSLNVSPVPSGPTIFNPDASHSFIVHIPPTTADIAATKEMVLMLNEIGIRVPHGWGDADDAYLHVLCTTCFGIDHLKAECGWRGVENTSAD